MIRVRDRDVQAVRQVDDATRALVPACSLGTLPSDPKHIDTLFSFCTNNWRTYRGKKPTGDKLVSSAIFLRTLAKLNKRSVT